MSAHSEQAVAEKNRPNRFAKHHHLLKPAEFQQVYSQKTWGGSREFAFNLSRNDQSYARLGLVVSRKVSKRAVDRNAIKRHIREWFRHNKQDLNGFDIIITAKPVLVAKSPNEITTSLADLWKKALKKSLSCRS